MAAASDGSAHPPPQPDEADGPRAKRMRARLPALPQNRNATPFYVQSQPDKGKSAMCQNCLCPFCETGAPYST